MIPLSKSISTKGSLNRRSLDFARDDKGEGGASMESSCRMEAFFIPLGGLQAYEHFGFKVLAQDLRLLLKCGLQLWRGAS
jgi:hypothetical protein